MALGIEQLRAAFKSNESEGTSRPNNYYPFWNIPDGATALIRFLPDANADNPMGFMVEKTMHHLDINGERKTTPCLKMYGDECPICNVSAAYYKEEDKVNGKKYWKKKQHLAQVLVMEDPLAPNSETNETHEGKVRFVALGFQIFNIIKDAFESGDLDEVPFSFIGGTDFLIKKTKQGDYPSYSLSKFIRRSTDLTEDQVALATEQMIDISTLLPQSPGLDKTEALLEAALTGNSLDETPSEPETPNFTSVAKKKPTTTEKPTNNTKVDEVETTTESSGEFEDEADNILQQIRSRQKNKD